MSGPADWSNRAQSNRPSDQVRVKVVCSNPLTTLLPDQQLLNHLGSVLAPYGSPPTANRWPHWEGVLPLCVFYSPSRQGGKNSGYISIRCTLPLMWGRCSSGVFLLIFSSLRFTAIIFNFSVPFYPRIAGPSKSVTKRCCRYFSLCVILSF